VKEKPHKSLTIRDLNAINVIGSFGLMRASVICKLIYKNERVAQRRLSAAVEAKKLKRVKSGKEFVYYVKHPKRTAHALTRSDFLGYLCGRVSLIRYEAEPDYDTVRPDALIVYDMGGQKHTALLEVQLTNRPDIAKYKAWDFTRWFERMPELIVICDTPFDPMGLPAARYGTDLKFKE
jgi:hypothetical protein